MSCCPPDSESTATFVASRYDASPSARLPDTVQIPGGIGLVGTNQPFLPLDGEGPLRQQALGPFRMSRGSITNADFAAFISETGYITEAEHIGWSYVFWSQVPDYVGQTQGVVNLEWWRAVEGACWNRLTGPKCTLAEGSLAEHPVVHISWNDANAYCSWAGGRLPTEAEWEHAARGGLGDVRFPWGELEPDDTEHFPCNIWQGQFPTDNTAKDGYLTTAPAISFEPNGYGLYNMAGNVWDWLSEPFINPMQRRRRAPGNFTHNSAPRLAKGGSFLCHKSYCYRYRIAARISNSPDSATTHMGFRVVWNTPD